MAKKKMIINDKKSINRIVNLLEEASAALNDKSRVIKTSSMPETLGGVLGVGVGGAGSLAALYSLGITGLSGAGIMTGIAAAGEIVGGGLIAGSAIIAAPAVLMTGVGVGIAAHIKNKKLNEQKELLYKEAISKHNAIINELKKEKKENKERIEYLNSLNIMLQAAIIDLKKDLEV